MLNKLCRIISYKLPAIWFTATVCSLLVLIYMASAEPNINLTIGYLSFGYFLLLVGLALFQANKFSIRARMLLRRDHIFATLACIVLLVYPHHHNHYLIYFLSTLLAWLTILLPVLFHLSSRYAKSLYIRKLGKPKPALAFAIAIWLLLIFSIDLADHSYFPIWVVIALSLYLYAMFFMTHLLTKLKYKANRQIIERLIKAHQRQHTRLPLEPVRLIYLRLFELDEISVNEQQLLIQLLRYYRKTTTVKLAGEVAWLEQFIQWQYYCFGDTVTVSFHYDRPTIKSSSYRLPPLIFLPLVNFAYDAGVKQVIPWPFIDIKLEVQGSQLIFELIFNAQASYSVQYINHQLTSLRQLLDESYGSDYQLLVNKQKQDHAIKLILPLN